MASLFDPFTLKSVTLKNRIAACALGVERAAWTLPAPCAHWLERDRTA